MTDEEPEDIDWREVELDEEPLRQRHTSAEEEMGHEEKLEHFREIFSDLKDSGFETRPHIQLPLESDEFKGALDAALDGETTHLEHGEWLIVVEDDLEFGQIHLDIMHRQEIESSLRDEKAVGTSDSDDQKIVEKYYSDGAIELKPWSHRSRNRYVTLLRDMSESCRHAADLMHEIVDEYPELVWGEEPKYRGAVDMYSFSGTIYYRPYE